MGALLIWSRSDGRRRLGALIGLALLVAVAGGATLATFAGARRSETAYERMRARTKAVDAAVLAEADQTEQAIRDPRVVASAPFSIAAVQSVDDPNLFPFVVPESDSIGRTIERPRILRGRRANPANAHEVVLPEAIARRTHKRVGDEMKFLSVRPGSVDTTSGSRPDPDGPRFALRVVGISRSPSGLAVRDRDLHFTYLTPAWRDRYGTAIGRVGAGTLVRLRHGGDSFGPWSRAVLPRLGPNSTVAALYGAASVEDSVSVIVDGLRLFALVAAIAGLVAVIQAIARHGTGSATDLDVLRALGLQRKAGAAASVLAVLPALVGGALGALLFAFVWSPFMPIGLARRAEPDPGWSFDGLVLVGGSVLILMVALLAAIAIGWRVSASQTARPVRSPRGRGARHLVGLPPVVLTGVQLATRRGRGRDVVPVRSALTGVAVAIAGVIAVGMFASGLHRLSREPARYGVPWDATASKPDRETTAADGARLAGIPEVRDVSLVFAQLGGFINGRVEGDGIAVKPTHGHLGPVMRAGRAPAAGDEIALGLDTAHRLGVQIGDHVRLSGSAGSRLTRVVGEVLFPTIDDPATLASGFLVSPEAARALGLDQDPDVFWRYVVTFDPGVSVARGKRVLEAAGFEVSTPAPPPEVARLRDVESLPRSLALILALIGSVVVVLALAITVRRRRRDLALLRVFGFTRIQLTGSVVCQAVVFALLGLFVGIPLGLVVGRRVWEHIAGALGVATDPAIPVAGMLLTALVVVLVAILAAVAPALRAARLRPAEILRGE